MAYIPTGFSSEYSALREIARRAAGAAAAAAQLPLVDDKRRVEVEGDGSANPTQDDIVRRHNIKVLAAVEEARQGVQGVQSREPSDVTTKLWGLAQAWVICSSFMFNIHREHRDDKDRINAVKTELECIASSENNEVAALWFRLAQLQLESFRLYKLMHCNQADVDYFGHMAISIAEKNASVFVGEIRQLSY